MIPRRRCRKTDLGERVPLDDAAYEPAAPTVCPLRESRGARVPKRFLALSAGCQSAYAQVVNASRDDPMLAGAAAARAVVAATLGGVVPVHT